MAHHTELGSAIKYWAFSDVETKICDLLNFRAFLMERAYAAQEK